ncbi:MAG: response regulator transcription factor [Anaerolineae bacterium]|jgi:two-component system KDP operon response regulator KdpE|nr:response regulator transcription factor [Anaerolineae bacterium]MDH7472786.1 response regulator transcription factor [Anaerolineae bacterium]
MKLLIVDEEPDVVKVVRAAFRAQEPNWEVLAASSGPEALQIIESEQPDLVLLDVVLPGMDGFSVLRELRRFSDVPVIMLTVRDDEVSKVTGLELGADDYITKPFGYLELVARVRAVLRRAEGLPLSYEEPFVCGDVRVDFSTRQVTVKGQAVELTNTEYRLLYHLVRNAGRPMSHEALLARVWGHEYTDEINYLKVYISRLRAKLEPDPQHPQYILTEYGFGYRFRAP